MHRSSVPLHWRRFGNRYKLVGNICENCGEIIYPVRFVCPKCGSKELKKAEFDPEGEIVTFSIVRVAPEGFEAQAPYAVAIIRLKDGINVTAQIVDCDLDEIEIGKKVEGVFRKVFEAGQEGIIQYGLKFKLKRGV